MKYLWTVSAIIWALASIGAAFRGSAARGEMRECLVLMMLSMILAELLEARDK